VFRFVLRLCVPNQVLLKVDSEVESTSEFGELAWSRSGLLHVGDDNYYDGVYRLGELIVWAVA
jgi:hypothetical protein